MIAYAGGSGGRGRRTLGQVRQDGEIQVGHSFRKHCRAEVRPGLPALLRALVQTQRSCVCT